MHRRYHKPIVWLLIASLAIVAGVGEAMHLIPGCGHGVRVGNTVVLLGISSPDRWRPTDNGPRVERPDGREIPIYDEDECAICSAAGRSFSSGDSPQFFLVMPLVYDLPAVALGDAPAATSHFFQARAPPLV